MNQFEKPFSGTPEDAKRLFDKMRRNVEEGIIEEVPIPPEFGAELSKEELERLIESAPKPESRPLPPSKERPSVVPTPRADFRTGAKAMEDWERERDEKLERQKEGDGAA